MYGLSGLGSIMRDIYRMLREMRFAESIPSQGKCRENARHVIAGNKLRRWYWRCGARGPPETVRNNKLQIKMWNDNFENW